MQSAPRMPADGSRVSDYTYELPTDRIARYPTERRDESRLLVVPPAPDPFRDETFRDVVDLFSEGDLLVLNESRVLPARLLGAKTTGAAAEILLTQVHPESDRIWDAIVRPGRKLKAGAVVRIADDLVVRVEEVLPDGGRRVRLETDLDVEDALIAHGKMPLPPYIDREAEALDRERYQTVYARTPGSIAAPTAGLHFTDALLDAIEARGVDRTAVTLHVGIGTFRPVETDDPAEHPMHEERYVVPPAAAEAVRATRARGGRVWAVGTTAVRTLEASAGEDGIPDVGSGRTDLFIRPGYRFRVVDGLITNFHLPRSTLMMLVAAFAGFDRTMDAYAHAIREGYRFYSYGDAMAIPVRADAG